MLLQHSTGSMVLTSQRWSKLTWCKSQTHLSIRLLRIHNPKPLSGSMLRAQWLNKQRPQKLMMLRPLKMKKIRLIKSKITLQEKKEPLLIKSLLLQVLQQSLAFSSQKLKLPPQLRLPLQLQPRLHQLSWVSSHHQQKRRHQLRLIMRVMPNQSQSQLNLDSFQRLQLLMLVIKVIKAPQTKVMEVLESQRVACPKTGQLITSHLEFMPQMEFHTHFKRSLLSVRWTNSQAC